MTVSLIDHHLWVYTIMYTIFVNKKEIITLIY